MSDLWKEFLGAEFLCGLCGNSGVIDTRGDVRGATGTPCGILAFCICPAGRSWKEGRAEINRLPTGRRR